MTADSSRVCPILVTYKVSPKGNQDSTLNTLQNSHKEVIELSKEQTEREKMTKEVRIYLGTILHNDLVLIKGVSEKLTPGTIVPQTRGHLLAIKTALDSAIEQLDSLLEFEALIDIVEDGDITINEEGWELDNTKRATDKLNGKRTMFT